MGLEQERKRLGEKRTEFADLTKQVSDLRAKQAHEAEAARKAQASADKIGKEAQALERKAATCAADIKRREASVERAEKAEQKKLAKRG